MDSPPLIILLRQSNVDPSTLESHKLRLNQCCYIRVAYAEIFHDRVQFFPEGGLEHNEIIKTDEHNWVEPSSGIAFEFLFVQPLRDYIPRHLEVHYPTEALLK